MHAVSFMLFTVCPPESRNKLIAMGFALDGLVASSISAGPSLARKRWRTGREACSGGYLNFLNKPGWMFVVSPTG